MIAPGLLPEGLRDRLPPAAEAAAAVERAALDAIAAYGYERVSPPLAEFEEALVGRLKSARAQDLLRFVDPVSQRTLALRPDITTQVGRITATRMAHRARPLRLSYAGSVIKLRATQLAPERELIQLGAELIGRDTVAAAAEIVAVAIAALEAAGAGAITVDLTLPDLVDTLAAGPFPLPADRIDRVRALLDAKDAGGLAAIGADAYLPLIHAAGPLENALARLETIDAGGVLASRIEAIRRIAAPLAGHATITLDPTERHGFEYQSWFGFSLFVDGLAGEIGRGGSYAIMHGDGLEEPAIGFSLYPDPLVERLAGASARDRLFLPLGVDPAQAAALRRQGWVTVAALDASDDAVALGCTHRLEDGEIVGF
ncbi:MAG: ATP phosphoribosyltransferase regulatory subunit [Sphingomonas sanxanigenens]|uniref:Histidine--tRNA ligase n=1 Tax=Sphingomonas sanxanigenens TaxID=397260 RepID=A0A2W5C4A6_9SPHN|nr:MAG: ATP phosphoribosyltransferase regulatory subunit [Sphingomonas sanxanigenens]